MFKWSLRVVYYSGVYCFFFPPVGSMFIKFLRFPKFLNRDRDVVFSGHDSTVLRQLPVNRQGLVQATLVQRFGFRVILYQGQERSLMPCGHHSDDDSSPEPARKPLDHSSNKRRHHVLFMIWVLGQNSLSDVRKIVASFIILHRFTFPRFRMDIWLVTKASLATGYLSVRYSSNTLLRSSSVASWRVENQLASVTASWMAKTAPAPPAGLI